MTPGGTLFAVACLLLVATALVAGLGVREPGTRFFEERPALEEVVTLQTSAGPVRVPYGYLSSRPSRAFLATGRAGFVFGFWIPGGRMPTGETNSASGLPNEPSSSDPLHQGHFIYIGPIVGSDTLSVGDLYLGPSSEQRMRNIFSIIGRDKFTYKVEPRITRAAPKPGTSAFDLYYSTPDGAGGPLPFDVRCPTQNWAGDDPICDGSVLFSSLGLFSEIRIRKEAAHLLPEALDTAARLLASWLGKDQSGLVP